MNHDTTCFTSIHFHCCCLTDKIFSANGEAYARRKNNLCWTETHARTVVGCAYTDADFHDSVKSIFMHVKQERADNEDDDIIKEANEAVAKQCAVR